MPKYPVITPLRWKGKKRMPSGSIEMSAEAAARIPAGVLGEPIAEEGATEDAGKADASPKTTRSASRKAR